MVQIEIIEKGSEQELVEDVNYFLSQLEEHLFIDIRYSSFFSGENILMPVRYSALILYRVE